MKAIRRMAAMAAVALASLFGSQSVSAQYWEVANQLPSLLSPALSGSGAYKGSVELTGVAGIGDNKLNQVEIATSQGYQYNSWFYMGVGVGVSVVRSNVGDDMWVGSDGGPGYFTHGEKKTGVMVPVFSDFRFNIPTGGNSGTSIFIDLRLGASWLCGDNYIEMRDGYLANQTMFYFRPAIGVRFPVNSSNPRQAVNIGVSYLLLTGNNSSYWYYGSDTPTLSALGATLSFEW